MPRLGKSRKSSSSSKNKGRKDTKMAVAAVLEMEMEMEQLPLTRRRNTGETDSLDDEDPDGVEDASSAFGCIRNMSNNQRRATLLFLTLAALVGFFVYNGEETIEAEFQGAEGGGGAEGGPFPLTEHVDLNGHVEIKPPKENFHTGGGFGGINNIAHPGGAKAASKGEGIAFAEIIIPKSNVGHAIPSLNRPNIVNSIGHYIHDEHRSPYASHLYDATKEELEERQQKYVEKMEKVRAEWGVWDFRDPFDDEIINGDTTTPGSDSSDRYRYSADFSGTPYKDLPVDDFPPSSWQADEEYVGRFLGEAKKLIHRVKEGIYAEYGFGLKDKDGKDKDAEFLKDREEKWKIHIHNNTDCKYDKNFRKCLNIPEGGLAILQDIAFDALVQKLLHAMMTNDEFYVILAGHSAAAGHGNDFQQNRIITFHHLMEPIFDKLGMRLISRNMGMGGVGTLQFSMAGGDLYGEMDLLEWDSGMTEKGPPVDMFNKQAILSGERVPVIISDQIFNLPEESNGTAWIGRIDDKLKKEFPETTFENAASQPYATRWISEKEEKYNAICWEPRSDFTPEKTQSTKVKSQVGWHPGNRQHHWSGRKLAMVVLEALGSAFELWEDSVAKEGVPLAASHWHVEESYKIIRENVRTHITTPKPDKDGKDFRSSCEKLLSWMPRVCRVQMHGFGMWLPRAHVEYDLLNIMHPAPNGYKPDFTTEKAYEGFAVLPLNQAIPDGEIDVHAIAIVTTNSPPDLDHSWIEDGEATAVNATENPPPTRRWLREASELAFRKGGEEIPASSNVVKQRKLWLENQEKAETVRPLLSSSKSMRHRQLEGDAANANGTAVTDTANAIVPGRGWEMHGWTPVRGLCDGTANSECSRNKDSTCMIVGPNDKHLDVWGNALSGWLVFTVPNVREGIILGRMEWWCNTGGKSPLITKEWTEVNNGMTHDTTPFNSTARRTMMDAHVDSNSEEAQRHRDLGGAKIETSVPKDFEMDIAINGVITKTMKKEEWVQYKAEPGKNVAVWPLLDDISMSEKDWDGESVEVAIRFRSELNPQAPFCVSHIYYA